MLYCLCVILWTAISWAFICGLLKLIALCFGIAFNLAIATGIWLIICLIRGVLK